MTWPEFLALSLVAAALVAVAAALLAWGARWGSTAAERAAPMPGDQLFGFSRAPRAVMTRAIDIAASPELIWPWLAQLGRGAGWYSYDRLDNGGRPSARHRVSWIPAPRLGDATPIGYLQRLEEGRGLVWWLGDLPFLGARASLAVDVALRAEGSGSRLVIRMSGAAAGAMARPALLVFRIIDSIMARRQLLGVRERVERCGARTADPGRPETGARDQFQLYEVIYADGQTAGVPGKEHARSWRRAAIEDGIIEGPP